MYGVGDSLATPLAGNDASARPAQRGVEMREGQGKPMKSIRDHPLAVLMLGGVLLISLAACQPATPPPSTATSDTLTLTDNDAGDDAVILFDGRRGGVCENDGILRANLAVDMASVEADGGCDAELTVFSDDDATVFVDSVSPPWSNAFGDDVAVDLSEPLYGIPLAIWIVTSDATTQASYEARAGADLARARQLYNMMNTGIGFDYDPTADLEIVSDPSQVATIVATANGVVSSGLCSTGAITGDASIHRSGRLNVYYATVTGLNGFECDNGGVIVMFTTANNETLSHEIGHALDMRHYAAGSDNIMWAVGISGRGNFTIGQAFRMNLNPGSALNVFGPRSGPTRSCADGAVTNTCPDITLDATPK